LAASGVRAFAIAGHCGIPADAGAVSMNVTVADATSAGSLTMFFGAGAPPGTNTMSFSASNNRANDVILGLEGGTLSVRNAQASGTINLIVDVNGYFL
jgi:hypothetical protein